MSEFSERYTTICLRREQYGRLEGYKDPSESYNDVVARLLDQRND